MKKKLIVCCLVSIIIAVLFSSCGKNENVETNTLTYWTTMDTSIATKVKSYNDVTMYKELENKTGIHVDFIHPAIGQVNEQFNLMIASGELPDMIEYKWTTYTGSPQKAIDDGVIISLNKYIDKYAPNFKKLVSGNDELSKSYDRGSKTDSGDYFAFSGFNTGSYRTFVGPFIRKDWLDELGLSVPETIDDWTNVLTQFKTKKGVAYPLTGVMGNYTGGRCSFEGAYGIGQRLYVDNGTVKFGPLESGYKEFVTLLHDWYKAGLLDQDFSTNTSEEMDYKILSNNSGAFFGSIGSNLGRYMNQAKAKGEELNFIGVKYPVKQIGDINRFDLGEQDLASASVAITTSCKSPETAVKWIDYLYSDEGYKLLNFGVEGDTYNMVDGKAVYTDKILKNPEGLGVSEALALNCRATSPSPGLRQAPDYLEQYYEFPQQLDALKLWSENVENTKTTKMPSGISATSDETMELSSMVTDITKYVEEMTDKFIKGAEPISNYDKFVETLKNNFNIERYIEIEQDMYDRYNNR